MAIQEPKDKSESSILLEIAPKNEGNSGIIPSYKIGKEGVFFFPRFELGTSLVRGKQSKKIYSLKHFNLSAQGLHFFPTEEKGENLPQVKPASRKQKAKQIGARGGQG